MKPLVYAALSYYLEEGVLLRDRILLVRREIHHKNLDLEFSAIDLHRASRRVELPPSQYLYFCTSSVRPSA
jgi:hypothetical protein